MSGTKTVLHGLSTIDQLYRSILLSKVFTHGWGKPENLRKLLKYRKILLDKSHKVHAVEKESLTSFIIDKERHDGDLNIIDGHFESPFANLFPDLVEKPVNTATFQMILPSKWKSKLRPMCIQLAGTGDHYFWRRRLFMAKPLAASGVGSILLENPFYGSRKPPKQVRSSLRNVTDLFVMGGSLAFECAALLKWCEENGYGPLALHGISMGGHMASLAATYWPKAVALIPCLSWTTASSVFTQGVMSNSIPWHVLENQFYGLQEITKGSESEIQTETVAFRCGKHFGLNFPESITRLQKLQDETNDNQQASCDEYSLLRKKIPNFVSVPKILSRKKATASEVVDFMRGVMDEFTHLGNYAKPVDPSLIIVVTAANDAYIPRHSVTSISELWPEAEIRYIPHTGHVQAALFYQKYFRQAILDALDRTACKYYSEIESSL